MSEERRRSVPCVLCRYQHRRHDGSCEFGQYFPNNRSMEFGSACRLFGVANLVRLMRSAEPSERQVMADSILREGYIWARNRPHGALGYSLALNSQIERAERELQAVNTMLAQFSNQPITDTNQGSQQNHEIGVSTSQIATTSLDVVASSSEPGQSSTVASDEKKGADQEKE